MKQQDYTKAAAKITAFSSHTSNLQAYKDLATIGLNLAMNNLGYADMDATQENTVRTIASGATSQAAKAKGILFDAYGELYGIDKPAINTGGSSKRQNTLENVAFPSIVGFSPNPANQQLQIHLSNSIEGETKVSSLVFYDLTGRQVKDIQLTGENNPSAIDVSQWANGIYLVLVKSEDKVIERHKIVVSK